MPKQESQAQQQDTQQETQQQDEEKPDRRDPIFLKVTAQLKQTRDELAALQRKITDDENAKKLEAEKADLISRAQGESAKVEIEKAMADFERRLSEERASADRREKIATAKAALALAGARDEYFVSGAVNAYIDNPANKDVTVDAWVEELKNDKARAAFFNSTRAVMSAPATGAPQIRPLSSENINDLRAKLSELAKDPSKAKEVKELSSRIVQLAIQQK